MENIEVYFAKAVRDRRLTQGLSQEAMAHAAGIHRTYASQVERAKVQVTIAVASQIANALGVRLSTLMRDVEMLVANMKEEG
ncbi:MAG: helix-turn-helix transcriptional regulator [Fuerstiella sp.]